MADQPPSSPRPDETPVDASLLPEAEIEALLAQAEALASEALEAAGVEDERPALDASGSSLAFDPDNSLPAAEQIEAQLARIQELVDEAADQTAGASEKFELPEHPTDRPDFEYPGARGEASAAGDEIVVDATTPVAADPCDAIDATIDAAPLGPAPETASSASVASGPDADVAGALGSPITLVPADAAAESQVPAGTGQVSAGAEHPAALPEAEIDPFRTPPPLDVSASTPRVSSPASSTSTDVGPAAASDGAAARPEPADEAVPIIEAAAAPPGRSRAVALIAAPFWAAAYLLVFLGRPFAGVSQSTKNLLGLLAGMTFIMAAVAWLLPTLLGPAAPPGRPPSAATTHAPAPGGH